MTGRQSVATRLLRLFLWPLRLPVERLIVPRLTVDDPWEESHSFLVHPALFGPGSTRPFTWYLEGSTAVPISSIEDIVTWLLGCHYASDPDLFNEPDFWQHPRTFEHLRRGDCEDHALWAWRQLLGLGVSARFVVGSCVPPKHPDSGHAWVLFDTESGTQLLDAVDKDRTRMIRPLADARGHYIPHFSVVGDGKMVAHAGYLLLMQQREARRRSASPGQAA